MKAYKGFNPDLTCRGFQFAEGQTFEEPTARLCKTGFHACLEPMDVLAYYHPANGAVIHEVEVDDDAKPKAGSDSKIASRKITIGARLDVMGMVKAHLTIVWDKVATVRAATPDEARYQSTAATSGDLSTAATSGDRSTAATSGHRSTAATSGDQSTAATSGDQSTAAVTGADSVAVAAGRKCTASGAEGCLLVLVERDNDGHITAHKSVLVGSKVNGRRIKPGAAYTLTDGVIVEALA